MSSTEIQPSRAKVPKSVAIILSNILLERYSTTGITAILALYFNRKLGFDPSIATAIFHTNELLAYLFTIFGAIVADSYWGLFKTITWMTLVFAFGSLLLAVVSIETLGLPMFELTCVGLIISVIGSGSIRANLTTFGGNQYKLPEEADKLRLYFSVQILFLKIGSLMGRFVNPLLKESVKCFGMNDCYPLPFGITSLAMLFSFLIFMHGRALYVRKPPGENMVVKVSKCVMYAISEKVKNHRVNPKVHWLDYSEEKFGAKLVAETKTVINVLVLYIPLPIYWAVYQQQGSRWIFQATRMNGDIGFYSVKPDQMIALNPAFAIITLPVLNTIIYPLLAKVKVTSLLQKMTVGGMLAVLAFIVAAFVEMKIEREFINIFWLAPQFLILALSENFLYVSHLSFAYNEAPSNMKSVMMSSVYVVIACGNIFVIIISGTKLFESQAVEFFFFAGILLIFMILFGFLASRYRSLNQ